MPKYSKRVAQIPALLCFCSLSLLASGCGPADQQSFSNEATTSPKSAPADLPFERIPKQSPGLLPAVFTEPPPTLAPRADFKPVCTSEACKIWAAYRAQRPFPWQAFAFARSGDKGVLIITEPTLSRPALESEIRDLFGSGTAVEAQRWLIGVDGWLGDLVITIPADAVPAPGDPLSDETFRGRLSLLAESLWGTSFGMYLEDARSSWRSTAAAAAPRLSLTAAEIQSWLLDGTRKWRDPAGREEHSFVDLANAGNVGTYIGSAGDLCLFMVDGDTLSRGTLEGQRADFRRFAILTDTVVGAIWNSTSGNLAIVGRLRQVPPSVMPPLRFETIEVLAAQDSDSLSQSYERTAPLAGRLFSGTYANNDWAPVYLSYDLIDTEYGALLNITDQLLKSWSQAGSIEYIYFNYPLRPASGHFVFGGDKISEILRKKTGGTSTLFNWNTAGAAAIVASDGWSALSPTRSSSLPITYGSELTPGSGMKMGEITQAYEDQAYDFYSGLGDPNLSRVVSYATVYQAFRANSRARRGSSSSIEPRTASGKLVKARARAGYAAHADQVATALAKLEAGEVTPGAVERQIAPLAAELGKLSREKQDAVRARLASVIEADLKSTVAKGQIVLRTFKASNPNYANNAELAKLLVDRGALATLFAQHDQAVNAYNSDVERYNRNNNSVSEIDLEQRKTQIIQNERALASLAKGLESLQSALSGPIELTGDVDVARAVFVEAHAQANVGWIRTPSIVLSWSSTDSYSVGGHNLDARVLRIEPKDGLTSARVVESESGPVLQVPPEHAAAARANANQLARLVEHGRAEQVELNQRLASLASPGPVRPSSVALGIARPADPMRAALGMRGGVSANASNAVRAIHAAARKAYGQPGMLAIRADNGEITVSFLRRGKEDCCVSMEDFASFRRVVQRELRNGDVVLQGFKEGQASALEISLSTSDQKAVVQALAGGGGSGGWIPPTSDSVHFFKAGKDRRSGDGLPPKEPPKVSLFFFGIENRPHLVWAAKEPRVFKEVSLVGDDATAAQISRNAGRPTAGEPVFRITFESRALSKTEAYAFVEVAPGGSRTDAIGAATRALDKAKEKTNLIDLTAEAKRIIASDPKRSSLKRLIIWVKESVGSFSLTEIVVTDDQSGRG